MSINTNRDGTITMISDADHTVTQTLAAGTTADQIATAYTTFQQSWPLAFFQAQYQAKLDAFFDANFDLKAFIRAGSSTTVTGTNVGNFLATITNNYRTLRAQITAATTVAQVQAVNINSGWPANP